MKKGLLFLMLSVLSLGAWADNPTSWNNPYLPSAKSGQQYAIRYTTDAMSHDANSAWMKVDYDDSDWTLGAGPIGHNNMNVPSGTAALGTSFDIYDKTQSYYLRREFTLDRDLAGKNIYMACGHDDEGTIWIDGTQIISWGNSWNETQVQTLTSEQTALLTKGKHVIAIWAKNNSGGYYWDCGLYGDDLSTNLDWGNDTSWKATYKYANATDAADPANDAAGYGWTNTIYNDADWSTMAMPCGSAWPKDNKGTKWEGENNRYWFRRPFLLTSIDKTKTYTLQFVHDDDYEIYINGKLLRSETGWHDNYSSPKYCIVPAEDLNVGENVIAARVTQFTGGSLFDCRLIATTASTVTFTATGQSVGDASKLFDGIADNKNNKWEGSAVDENNYYKTNYALFSASQAIYVNGLTLYTGNDDETNKNRSPRTWKLYGSNTSSAATNANDDSWQLIQTVYHTMPNTNATPVSFKFNPQQTAYQYFKFEVNSLSGATWMQVGELELDYTLTAKSPITRIADGGNKPGYGEVAANIFDGSGSTKWYKEANSNWVVFKTAKPIYATKYIIQTANDYNDRDPKTFQLYGAMESAPTQNGSTTGWTKIDSETDASGTITTERFAFATFSIDNPGIYQYFMLKIDDTRGSNPAVQFSEFIFDDAIEVETYNISNPTELANFAKKVNGGEDKVVAKITSDIVADGNFTSIGTTTNKFGGIFDGQGHSITINVGSSSEYQGLIGCADNGAYIKNVIVKGSVAGLSRCGGVLGGSNGATGTITLLNCGNEASVTVKGQNAAGVVGCNSGGSAIYNLTNCYNAGTIKGGSESAGISGWLGSGATVTNCYNIGSVTGDEKGRTFTRSKDDGCVHSNCYSSLNVEHYSGEITTNYSMDKVHSGELCVALGNAFTQDLSQADSHPTFGSKTVTAGKWFNNTDNDVYYNLEDGNYTVYQLNLNEANTKYDVPANVTAKNVSMTRTLKAGVWNTFCVPFAMEKSLLGANAEVKELTGATKNGDNYTMTFSDAGTIDAGKPYMVRVAENEYNGTIEIENASGIAVNTTGTPFVTEDGVTFTGVYTSGLAPRGSFIISNNVFYNVDSDVSLKAFRGYITVAGAGVKALNFDFDDDATGISLMEDGRSKMEDGAIYNVAGQRLDNSQFTIHNSQLKRGIYIVNGKKILK